MYLFTRPDVPSTVHMRPQVVIFSLSSVFNSFFSHPNPSNLAYSAVGRCSRSAHVWGTMLLLLLLLLSSSMLLLQLMIFVISKTCLQPRYFRNTHFAVQLQSVPTCNMRSYLIDVHPRPIGNAIVTFFNIISQLPLCFNRNFSYWKSFVLKQNATIVIEK